MSPFNLFINKSVDGLLGIRTQGGRMEGADKFSELRRHPNNTSLIETHNYKIYSPPNNCNS